MIKSLFNSALVVALATGISACGSLFGNEGYFRDRGDDYLKSDTIPPMKVPENMQTGAVEQLYVIPGTKVEEQEFAEESYEVPRPQPLAANQATEQVKIQRLGQNRWILINKPPSEAWPRVRNFLSRTGLQVAFTDATNGIIETSWLQFKDDPENRDRYRLRIEQGVQPDSTEIHVLHMSVDKSAVNANLTWPKNSVNPERESWMIDELSATLASESGDGAASLLAQTIGGNAKVQFVNAQGEAYLRMELDYLRAWATMGYALQREGFTLWDEDREIGVYYAGYSTPKDEEESGFFRGWFGGDDQPVITSPYTLEQILAHLQLQDNPENRHVLASLSGRTSDNSIGEPLQAVPGYLVFVRAVDNNNIEVRIRDGYAKKPSAKETKRLLKVIRRNLI